MECKHLFIASFRVLKEHIILKPSRAINLIGRTGESNFLQGCATASIKLILHARARVMLRGCISHRPYARCYVSPGAGTSWFRGNYGYRNRLLFTSRFIASNSICCPRVVWPYLAPCRDGSTDCSPRFLARSQSLLVAFRWERSGGLGFMGGICFAAADPRSIPPPLIHSPITNAYFCTAIPLGHFHSVRPFCLCTATPPL